MKNLDLLEIYRVKSKEILAHYGSYGDETCGVFLIPVCPPLKIVASAGEGWDHVSVSTPNRPPTWAEMEHVKRTFFKEDETAMQLHVPPSDHINCHPNCLHLWRPHNESIPRPPAWMIAPLSPSND